MARFLKKRTIIITVVLIAATVLSFWFYSRRDKGEVYETATVRTGNIIQEVSVTGRVKSSQSVELAFKQSGRVAGVPVTVGTRVVNGQILAVLASDELASELAQAEAKLKAERAKLDELIRGTRPEEVRVQEVKVENAKTAVSDAQTNLLDKIKDAYTKTDDAIRTKVDQFFSSPRTSSPQVNFTADDPALELALERERVAMEAMLNQWQSDLDKLQTSSDLAAAASRGRQNLETVKSFLEKAALALNTTRATAGLTQATIDGYRSDVSTARTNVNTAVTNLSSAEEKLRSSYSALLLAENELSLKEAGATTEEIAAQEAKTEEAEASVQNYRAKLAETALRAPISGVVTRQEAKIGEIAPANTAVVSLISDAKFEIEANIAEADIAKVKVGQSAAVTLDAYGDDVVFETRVVKIDPAETIIEGVATYKTTLQFVKDDERIKSGMTANVNIETARRENVLVIPQRAVIARNGEKIVRLLQNGKIAEVEVKVGVRGSDGSVEIAEGLKEGDRAVVFIKEK